MSPTPELNLPDNLRDGDKTACPFRHLLLPGPVSGQLSWKDLPCIQDKCSLWCNQATVCSIKVIAVALDSIGRHTERIPTNLRLLREQLDATAGELLSKIIR